MSDSYDGDLAEVIFGQAADSDTLPDEAKSLVLAALEGDDELTAALNGTYVHDTPAVDVPMTEPVGAYLRSIEVRGFRGVGPGATLEVRPMAGLTVVVGRNGSGKSTFSDALELALTGTTYRWRKKRPVAWSEHWRNVHDGRPCRIRVELAEEGIGVTTVGVDWSDDAALADRRTWVQRKGEKRESGVSVLGWDRAIELYQPILSYDELGGVLEQGPSTLFDKIDAILGIEQATDAEKRLGVAVKELQQPDKDAKVQTRDLKKALDTLTDERARLAREHLRKRDPSLDAIEAIATGTTREAVGEVVQLKELTRLALPAREDVAVAVQALRDAAVAHAEAAIGSVDLATRRASLLREVLTFHDHQGDGQCPVCGEGALNSAWRAKVVEELGTDLGEIDRLIATSVSELTRMHGALR